MDATTAAIFGLDALGSPHKTSIEELLYMHLPQIREELGEPQPIEDVCLLADAGEMLVHQLEILVRFAHILAHDYPAQQYVDRRISDSAREDDLSDLGIVDYLHDKHAALKEVYSRLSETAIALRSSWNLSPPPPPLNKIQPSPYFLTSQGPIPEQSIASTSTHIVDPHEDSLHIETPDSQAVQEPDNTTPMAEPHYRMEDLASRGKGSYTCPHGQKCTKGGVSPSGHIAVFERNSAFR
jgi:hypothetical protein